MPSVLYVATSNVYKVYIRVYMFTCMHTCTCIYTCTCIHYMYMGSALAHDSINLCGMQLWYAIYITPRLTNQIAWIAVGIRPSFQEYDILYPYRLMCMQVFCCHHMEWDQSYTAQKMAPLITQWAIREALRGDTPPSAVSPSRYTVIHYFTSHSCVLSCTCPHAMYMYMHFVQVHTCTLYTGNYCAYVVTFA